MKLRPYNNRIRSLEEVAVMAGSFRGRAVFTIASLVSALLAGSINPAFASEEKNGTFGATFLRVPIGAKVMAVPDIVAGMQADASLTFSNPALVADLNRGQLFLSTANWLDDLSLNAASFAMPIGSSGLTWSLGSRFLYSGDLQGFDSSNQLVETDSYYDVSASTGLAKRFEGIGLAIGGDVTYIRSHMPDADGDGLTFDVGASYQLNAHRVDLFARDLGGKISYKDRDYDIDSRVVLGYGYMLHRGWGRLDMGGQISMSRSEYQRVRIGASYAMNNYLTLRSGFNHVFATETSTGVPITAGFGFHYRSVSLDYAFTEHEYFSNTHTFSLVFGFGHRSGTAGSLSQERTVSSTPAQTTTTPPPAAAAAPVVVQPPADAASYDVVAGTHNRYESARAEVRALRLLNVPAVVEQVDGKYRVRIGRYDTLSAAEAAVESFKNKGHRFTIVAGTP